MNRIGSRSVRGTAKDGNGMFDFILNEEKSSLWYFHNSCPQGKQGVYMQKSVVMRGVFLWCLSLMSVLAACSALAASGSAKYAVTELEFLTYGFSDPDPVPHTESPLYPYFRFDGSVAKSVPKKWNWLRWLIC
jgi:hypothetical protein